MTGKTRSPSETGDAILAFGCAAADSYPSLQDRLRAHLNGCSEGSQKSFHGMLDSWSASIDAPFPASPNQIRDFVRLQATKGRAGNPLRPQSIRLMLRHLSNLHTRILRVKDPTQHILVTSEMRALFRERGSLAKPTVPLRLKGDVADIIADEPLPGSIIAMLRALDNDDSPWALRARVVLGLGADTGRSRSEYTAVDIGHIVAMSDGSGTAFFGGAPRYLSAETLGFISAWLSWRETIRPRSTRPTEALITGIDQQRRPTNRLTVDGYVDVLRDIMRRIGCGLPISGNSFQVGLKLDLAAIGTTAISIANALEFKEMS